MASGRSPRILVGERTAVDSKGRRLAPIGFVSGESTAVVPKFQLLAMPSCRSELAAKGGEPLNSTSLARWEEG